MTSHDLTLWGTGTVRQLRPHWMLTELGLDYEFHPVHPRTGQTMTPEFLKLNPRHKVPLLRHGTFLITESAAICQYLSETFDDTDALHVPRDPVARARMNEWSFFIMSELDATSLYIIRRHGDLKHLYGEAPRALEAARDYFLENITAMAPRIGQEHCYLLADKLSVPDILLTSCLDWAVGIGIPLPEPVARYHARVLERPAYKAARAKAFTPPPK